jgi:hypothetical protein
MALSASVSQEHISWTKDILCKPWSDLLRMTRSGLCVCTMADAKIDLPPGTCSPSKLQYTSTVLRLSRADFRQPAMCYKTESCLQVHCVVPMNMNMEKHLFHSVPTEMALDRGTLPPLFKVGEGGECVNAGIQSILQNTTMKILHVQLPSDALTLSLQESKEVSLPIGWTACGHLLNPVKAGLF